MSGAANGFGGNTEKAFTPVRAHQSLPPSPLSVSQPRNFPVAQKAVPGTELCLLFLISKAMRLQGFALFKTLTHSFSET